MPNVNVAAENRTVGAIPAPTPAGRPPAAPALLDHAPRKGAAGSGQRWTWFLAGGAATAAILAVGWFLGSWLGLLGHDRRESLPPEELVERDPQAVPVTLAPVTLHTVQRAVEAIGTLHGFEEVTIAPKVEGRIVKIHHEVADRVSPGEVLFEIDRSDYELSVRQATKALSVELTRLGLDRPPPPNFDITGIPVVVQASAKLENAKARLERSRQLAARQVATAEEIADRTTELRVTQAEYEQQLVLAKVILATIETRQEALAIAQQQLDETVVRTPRPTRDFPGQTDQPIYSVSQRMISEGTYVRPGAEALRLVIDQTLKLRAAVPELSGGDVRLGQHASVAAAALREPYAGTVTRIDPVVDSKTRTFEVEIQVPNPRGELKPGGFAKTSIETRDERAAAVPIEAVVKFAGITKIFLAENGRAKEVHVTLGEQGNTWVEIATPDLPSDAQVVTSGQSALADGMPLAVRSLAKKQDKSGQ